MGFWLSKKVNGAEVAVAPRAAVAYAKYEWVRAFVVRRPGGVIIAGYETTNGFRDSLIYTDPDPIEAPGAFYLRAHSLIAHFDDATFSPSNDNPCPWIILRSPHGGETLSGGDVYTIRWDSANLTSGRIQISMDVGSGWQLISSTPDLAKRSYEWIVPQINATNANLYVGLWNGSQWSTFEYSDGPFAINQTAPAPVWKTSGNFPNCGGPDEAGVAWFATNFDDATWAEVIPPDFNWGCDNCDRFCRLNLPVTGPGTITKVHFASDDGIWLYANGALVGHWGSECHAGGCVNDPRGLCGYFTTDVPLIDLTPYLQIGNNVLAAHVTDQGGGDYFDLQVSQTVPIYCGEVDGDGTINIADAVFLINYIFAGGPVPNPLEAADVNCSSGIDIVDAVYMINYIFASGPQPCAACP